MIFSKYISSVIQTQSSDMEIFFGSIFITFIVSISTSSPENSRNNLKVAIATVLKGVYIFGKSNNVVTKQNKSTQWNTLGVLLADKIEYY